MTVSRSSHCAGALTRRASLLSALALFCSIAPSACTKSHDIELDDQALRAGTSARPTAGRSSATAGRTGSGTAARGGSAAAGRSGGGTAGRGAATGCTNCEALSVGGFITLAACCTEDNKCGADLSSLGAPGCAEVNAPGDADPACPSQSLMGFLTLQGCCRPDGTCGTLDTFIGLGCTTGLNTEEVTCKP